MLQNLFVIWGSGVLGALLETLLGWAAGTYGILALLHCNLQPPLKAEVLYLRLTWGGIWALAYFFPGIKTLAWWQSGMLLSLFPSAAQLLYFFPQSGAGYFGVDHGWGTPIIVIVLNLIWGWVTTFSIQRAK